MAWPPVRRKPGQTFPVVYVLDGNHAFGQVAMAALSGGNQQKVVLARSLGANRKLLVLEEPTAGVDVGAKAEIYRLLRDLADRGVVIIMVTSDMEEVLGVSDRLAVMHEGRISGFLQRSEFSEEAVMRLAVGQAVAEVHA